MPAWPRFPRSNVGREDVRRTWMTPGGGGGRSAVVAATPAPPTPMKRAAPAQIAAAYATLKVATSDTTDAGKFAADPYVGDGTSAGDLAALQAALTDLDDSSIVPARAGLIQILEGDLDLGSGTLTIATDTEIIGTGKQGTILHGGGGHNLFDVGDHQFSVKSLQVEGATVAFYLDILSLGLDIDDVLFNSCPHVLTGTYSSGNQIVYGVRLTDVKCEGCGTGGAPMFDFQRRLFNAKINGLEMTGTPSGVTTLAITSNDGNDGNYIDIIGGAIQGHVTIDQVYGLTIVGADFRNNLTLSNIDNYRIGMSSCESTYDDSTACTNGQKGHNNGIV